MNQTATPADNIGTGSVRNWFLKILTLFFWLLIAACQSGVAYETCGGISSCPPPSDDKATETIKKLRAEISGKWKLAAIDTRDTFHKTGQTWTNLRLGLCISYDGGVQLLRDYKEPVCQFCHSFATAGDTLQVVVDEAGLSKYCLENFNTSTVVVRNDSLIITRQDSFVIKKSIYRRMNDDGTFKLNQ